jgi:uncharacterized protein with PIN domain
MLGSLARWLRILGFDTIYFRAIANNELIKIARQQERIILTRDTGIARRKQIHELILIHSNATLEQLKEVLSSKRLFPGSDALRLSPRCPVCNGELALTQRETVADSIPEYIFLNATSFFTCKECGKVYWYGSHKKSIDFILKQVIGDR